MADRRGRQTQLGHAASPASQDTARLILPRLTVQRLALLLGLGLLSVAALLALGGGREAMRALTRVDVRFLALAVAVHYSGFALRGLRWQQLLLTMGHRLAYSDAAALLLAGWFVSALLPARAGDLLRVGVLRLPGREHDPVPVAEGLGSIVLERVLDIIAILGLGAGFSLLVAHERLPDGLVTAYVIGVGLLALLSAALVVSPLLLTWLGRRWSHVRWQALIAFALQFVVSLRTLFSRPGMAFLIVAESFAIWLCDVALLWLAARSVAEAISFGEAGFVAMSVDVIAAIPLTPGGIGQIEAAYAALLAVVAGAAVNVGAVVLVTRLVSYWSFLLFSGVVTFAAGFGALLTNQQASHQPSTAPFTGLPSNGDANDETDSAGLRAMTETKGTLRDTHPDRA